MPSVAKGWTGAVCPATGVTGTIAASMAGFTFVSRSHSLGGSFDAHASLVNLRPVLEMPWTVVIFESCGVDTMSTTFHAGELPWGGSMPLLPDVNHSVVSNTRKAIRPENATRKPRRAPRFVPSNRYTEPQNRPP